MDLGHFAWILAIFLGFELFGRIWLRIGPKEDEALRMVVGGKDGLMDGRMDRFPLRSTGLCPLWGRCPKRRYRKREEVDVDEEFVTEEEEEKRKKKRKK